MEDLLTFIAKPLGQLVLWAIAILSAVLLYFLSKKEKVPLYAYDSMTLVEGLSTRLPGLEVRYAGERQERVTVTRVFFWNAGRETIRSTDLTDLAPLRVEVAPGAEVLSCVTTYRSDSASKFDYRGIEKKVGEPTVIRLHFDYLDCNEGGVLQITHTGPVDHPISITGKVIGARETRYAFGAHNFQLTYRGVLGWLAPGGVTGLNLLILTTLSVALFSQSLYGLLIGRKEWFFWLGAAIGFLLTALLLWSLYRLRSIPRKLIAGGKT